MLLINAKDNGIGKIIGNKSSYRACNYGDLLAYELPNTQIKGFVSHKIFNRPDMNKCNEISLIPDIYLPVRWSDVLEGKDVYWEWILKHY
ncbi:hypothetical protein FACS1894182_13720 [Bacteroidia bacterium]|nr:hypothetical protein FACS1894182_13720 [Bacteroidia bacterium]